MHRRSFIKLSAAGALAGVAGLRAGAASAENLRLSAGPARHRFEAAQQQPSEVLAYDGMIPGPLLRLRQGVETEIRFVNDLDEPTTVHWHGLRIANAMDGVPDLTQPAVMPGEEFVYRLTPPDAGTFWYHSHHRSWWQMALGLAGVLIVDEAEPPVVDQDLVFAVDDWRLDDDYAIERQSLGALHDWAHAGRLGNYATVNGQSRPRFAVTRGERVRLRLVNIANARIMVLRLPDVPAWEVAVDGQPLAPRELVDRRVVLAPGQRSDLVVDLAGAPGSEAPVELLARGQTLEIARFVYADAPGRAPRAAAPAALADNPANRVALPAPGATQRVPLRLEGGAMGGLRGAIHQGRELDMRELMAAGQVWAINGVAGLPRAPLFRVARGAAVSLDVVNDNAWPHGMHVHGHHFVDERDPAAWRDTALFQRGERGSLRFVADNPGKWLIHCHTSEHMAGGMATWFEVT